ncbi:MAG: hypothetical protein H6708_33955 [Kofleriaceae bacterium]|nr:hypothetical protein [Kofleriaceae bacterium]
MAAGRGSGVPRPTASKQLAGARLARRRRIDDDRAGDGIAVDRLEPHREPQRRQPGLAGDQLAGRRRQQRGIERHRDPGVAVTRHGRRRQLADGQPRARRREHVELDRAGADQEAVGDLAEVAADDGVARRVGGVAAALDVHRRGRRRRALAVRRAGPVIAGGQRGQRRGHGSGAGHADTFQRCSPSSISEAWRASSARSRVVKSS